MALVDELQGLAQDWRDEADRYDASPRPAANPSDELVLLGKTTMLRRHAEALEWLLKTGEF
jgi:hypothetical protein